MADKDFVTTMSEGYHTEGESVLLGCAFHNGPAEPGAVITVPLRTLNRHGLVAGATGTGKTKTLQVIAEGLSEKGVPVLMMDIKGDLSGIAAPGSMNDRIAARHKELGIEWKPASVPVEFLTLSNEPGLRLRATVSEFGPVLFSKILALNDTQAGVVSLVFKYSDDKKLPLLDLKDFRKVLQYLMNEGKDEIRQEYGTLSSTSAGTILRKIIEIEEQGADVFFGEVSFDVHDLLRTDANGKGVVNMLRLSDIQDRPKLFSTFMLCLLAEIYAVFPEQGDAPKPRLVLFIDEAHLIFKEASKDLLDQIESIIKLIRSKGVGIIFCTQSPTDIPAAVLGQLGLKIQHALRAFTANDRKAIKLAAQNYPETDLYDVDELITQLGTGQALVTVITEKGAPSPLAAVTMRSPGSRMDILQPAELSNLVNASPLAGKYNTATDRDSAFEMLQRKLQPDHTTAEPERKAQTAKTGDDGSSVIGDLINSTTGRQVARTLTRELTRGLLGVLGLGGSKRRR